MAKQIIKKKAPIRARARAWRIQPHAGAFFVTA